MYVLVVEDDDLIRQLVAEVIGDAGFVVVDAPTAENALELAEGLLPPNIIVSDVNLGSGMNGLTLANEARCRWSNVPVLLISGLQSNFVGQSSRPGVAFLSKPFSPAALLRNVTTLLAATGSPPAR